MVEHWDKWRAHIMEKTNSFFFSFKGYPCLF
jgi:hypothetical protein